MGALTSTNCLIMAKDKKKNDNGSEKYSEKDQWNDDLDLPPLNHKNESIKKPILEKAEFDRKKKKRWIPLLVVISIIAGSTPFILNNCEGVNVPNKMKMTSNASEDSNPDSSENNHLNEEAPEEIAFIEDTVIIENIDSEEGMEIVLNEEDPKYYHIIIGSFEQENYAVAFVDQLEHKIDATQIMEYNGLYRISYNSYNDSDEAEIELDYIRNTLNLKSWIAYMR